MTEFTNRAIILGIILSMLLCAANIYLGLYAGMTVCASIPAAVISMGILRGILRKGTILENNIVQTMASAGESLAAGIIFTLPALIIIGKWKDFGYWETTFIAIIGGILGVIFMVPLRHSLIVEAKELIFPEGIACAEVLKAPEGKGIKYVFSGIVIGAIFKFFVSGISVIKEVIKVAGYLFNTIFYFGWDISPALLGVGYIVGFNVAVLCFLGGVISWLIGIPIYYYFQKTIALNPITKAEAIWSNSIRYIGVGAMLIGGIWSIISIRKSVANGIKRAIKIKAQEDLPIKYIFYSAIFIIIATLLLYLWLIKYPSISIVSAILMTIAGFFFVAVSSYIVGLVGSSNNPVSGMTIVTILFSALILLLFGIKGQEGIYACILIAAIVCCAACSAGDISQDLKTGYIVGATPKKQQIAQIIGVIVAAFIIMPILSLLHKAYGIGVKLRAPQASLFASLTTILFTDKKFPLLMVLIGILVAVIIIAIDEGLKKKGSHFRLYVMPVAVGLYLPLALSVPICIGGIISKIVKRNNLTLLSAGLIAGEAIIGIIIAAIIVAGIHLPIIIFQNSLFSIGAFAILILAFIKLGKKQ